MEHFNVTKRTMPISRRVGTTDLLDQANAMINSAYERGLRDGLARGFDDGWNKAIAAFGEAMGKLRGVESGQPGKLEPVVNGPRPGSAVAIVASIVQRTPGLSGIEIFKAIEAEGHQINYHTMRTAIHRLKDRHEIRQRQRKWYPMSRGDNEREIREASHREEAA